MPQYLLLRNNQKSGPYSLEEMMGMGVVASDLIWIEGASTCWRYPYELDDFRKIRSVTVLPIWQSFMHTELPKADYVRFPAFSLQNHLATPVPTLAVHGVSEQGNASLEISLASELGKEARAYGGTQTQEDSSSPIFEDPYWALTIAAFMHGMPSHSTSVLERRQAIGGKNIRRSRKKNHHLDLTSLITGGLLPVRMPMPTRITEGGFPIAFA